MRSLSQAAHTGPLRSKVRFEAGADDLIDSIELVDHLEKEGPIPFVPGAIPNI